MTAHEGAAITGDTPLREVMRSDVICVQVDTKASLVDILMQHHPIHHLPVLRGRVLRGIVSQTDLYRNMLSLFYIEDEAEQHAFLDEFLDVPSMMTPEPLTLGPDQTVRDALHLMLEQRVGAVPVVDERNELLGIVTDHDLLRLMERLL